jgi:hypothetical protein
VLKKTITYKDFNDEEVTEDFYFHLSKAELIEIELSHQGGLAESLRRIVASSDGKAIITEFKNIIMGAYGQRSPDGRRFVKSQDLRDEFAASPAYDVLFVELVTDTQAAIDFINGIVPSGLIEEAAKMVEAAGVNNTPAQVEPSTPPTEATIISRKEVEEMSTGEFAQLSGRIASGEVVLGD